jgi:hypothetical protein
MKKTKNVAEMMKTFLERVPGIQYAFIYSSFPKRAKNLKGEMDVMVIGGPDLAEMDQIISIAEEELKRGIRLTSFTVREFRERVKVKDKLVLKALNRPTTMLIGDENEMGRLIA